MLVQFANALGKVALGPATLYFRAPPARAAQKRIQSGKAKERKPVEPDKPGDKPPQFQKGEGSEFDRHKGEWAEPEASVIRTTG